MQKKYLFIFGLLSFCTLLQGAGYKYPSKEARAAARQERKEANRQRKEEAAQKRQSDIKTAIAELMHRERKLNDIFYTMERLSNQYTCHIMEEHETNRNAIIEWWEITKQWRKLKSYFHEHDVSMEKPEWHLPAAVMYDGVMFILTILHEVMKNDEYMQEEIVAECYYHALVLSSDTNSKIYAPPVPYLTCSDIIRMMCRHANTYDYYCGTVHLSRKDFTGHFASKTPSRLLLDLCNKKYHKKAYGNYKSLPH